MKSLESEGCIWHNWTRWFWIQLLILNLQSNHSTQSLALCWSSLPWHKSGSWDQQWLQSLEGHRLPLHLLWSPCQCSVPTDLHSAIEVAQHHVSSLQEDLCKMGLDGLWERGKHGLLFPTHINFFSFFCSIQRGAALSESPLSPWSWMGLLFQGPVCPCWSLQVPGRCLKIQGCTFHTPHHRIVVRPCCIWNINL